MAADATRSPAVFDPARFREFRFLDRTLDGDGRVTLRYALDDELVFVEELELPVRELDERARAGAEGLLALLHWVAGVSYFKVAAPPAVSCESGSPPPAAAALLQALYSEGLGEFAYANGMPALPAPRFGAGGAPSAPTRPETHAPRRALVPIGGGKDSAVALEIMRRFGCEVVLFSVASPGPIARTAAAAQLTHLVAQRRLDPALGALNRAGALNGHVPVTAIVCCIALLTAALAGFDTVVMANERSASSGNLVWDGLEINHQFSKGLRAERLLRGALAEAAPGLQLFSVLRPASELAIARAFSRLERYHGAFASCNAIFRGDPERRAQSWCCECPKCRFVFLMLAPFMGPEQLRTLFGRDLLAEEGQFEGFALLLASGGHKPFECVGEERESAVAVRMLVADPRWREHPLVVRLGELVRADAAAAEADARDVLALSDDHEVPAELLPDVREILRA